MVRFRLSSASKYKNKKTPYNGRVYDSEREALHARQLDLLKLAPPESQVARWEPQVSVPLVVNGVKVCTWRIDFLVFYSDGRKEYHEVKGVETDVFKLKYKLFQALYPDAKVRIVK